MDGISRLITMGVILFGSSCTDGGTITPETDETPRVDLSGVLTIDLDAPADYATPDYPAHYDAGVLAGRNTPADNPVTDQGATLGRVLFYDEALSVNRTTSCASCHAQADGFTDEERFSRGFEGELTGAHSMRLANAVFFEGAVMFWDGRAADVEDQVLRPIQDPTEMGFDAAAGGLDALVERLQGTTYYPMLFEWAFGTDDVTVDRMERALAQYVRSIVSTGSRFDDAVTAAGGLPPGGQGGLPGFTAEENLGLQLFLAPPDRGGAGCAGCHRPPTMALDPDSRSNGLDAGEDQIFKSPSLKNVAAATGYMHDGRFTTLDEVVEHYSTGVRDGPALDPRLGRPGGGPLRLNLDPVEKAALVAFLETLTDTALLEDDRFSDPFVR